MEAFGDSNSGASQDNEPSAFGSKVPQSIREQHAHPGKTSSTKLRLGRVNETRFSRRRSEV
jgi:hypothetical protein